MIAALIGAIMGVFATWLGFFIFGILIVWIASWPWGTFFQGLIFLVIACSIFYHLIRIIRYGFNVAVQWSRDYPWRCIIGWIGVTIGFLVLAALTEWQPWLNDHSALKITVLFIGLLMNGHMYIFLGYWFYRAVNGFLSWFN